MLDTPPFLPPCACTCQEELFQRGTHPQLRSTAACVRQSRDPLLSALETVHQAQRQTTAAATACLWQIARAIERATNEMQCVGDTLSCSNGRERVRSKGSCSRRKQVVDSEVQDFVSVPDATTIVRHTAPRYANATFGSRHQKHSVWLYCTPILFRLRSLVIATR
jgi:hypothetical protein